MKNQDSARNHITYLNPKNRWPVMKVKVKFLKTLILESGYSLTFLLTAFFHVKANGKATYPSSKTRPDQIASKLKE